MNIFQYFFLLSQTGPRPLSSSYPRLCGTLVEPGHCWDQLEPSHTRQTKIKEHHLKDLDQYHPSQQSMVIVCHSSKEIPDKQSQQSITDAMVDETRQLAKPSCEVMSCGLQDFGKRILILGQEINSLMWCEYSNFVQTADRVFLLFFTNMFIIFSYYTCEVIKKTHISLSIIKIQVFWRIVQPWLCYGSLSRCYFS